MKASVRLIVVAIALMTWSTDAMAASPLPSPSHSLPPTTPASAGAVAFLLPDKADSHYDSVDAPAFAAALGKVCPETHLISTNATGDADLQQRQIEDAVAAGAKVLVVDPVRSPTPSGRR